MGRDGPLAPVETGKALPRGDCIHGRCRHPHPPSLVRTRSCQPRRLAGFGPLACGATSLARCNHTSLRAGVESSGGRQLLGRVAIRRPGSGRRLSGPRHLDREPRTIGSGLYRGSVASVVLGRVLCVGAGRVRPRSSHQRFGSTALRSCRASCGDAAGGGWHGAVARKRHTGSPVLRATRVDAGLRPIVFDRARPGAAYPALAARLDRWARPNDLVLVHSIPSGVVGLSRYLSRPISVATWIEQFGSRNNPHDLDVLLAGRARVALVQVHNLGKPSLAETWLRSRGPIVGDEVWIGSTKHSLPISIRSLRPNSTSEANTSLLRFSTSISRSAGRFSGRYR